ncbi:MAG: hypothetical protein J5564_04430 [Clostridia bacterium]|nr:hypothetical protein [Clostridia bacterium]
MKYTKILVVALLIALLACLAVTATAEDKCVGDLHYGNVTATVLVEATCTKTGITEYSCDACGNVWRKETAMKAHQISDEYNKQVPSTCTKQGYNARTCSVCGAEFDKIALPLADHTWVEMAPKKEPTCLTPGCKALQHCSVCDARRGGETIPATGHNIAGAQWLVIREATCAKEGLIGRFCLNANCDLGVSIVSDPDGIGMEWAAIEKKSVAKTDHDPANVVVIAKAKDPTCETNGCTALKQCSLCGAQWGGEVRAKLGHNLNGAQWLIIKNPTCAEEGLIGRYCQNDPSVCELGGKSNDYDGANKAFAIETKTVAKTNDHQWVEIAPYKAPTCETPGCYAEYQCSVCGLKDGVSKINALGHNLNGAQWTIIKNPTCASEGLIGRFCQRDASVCEKGGKAMESTPAKWAALELQTVPKLNGVNDHDWVPIIGAKPATCEQPGCEALEQCSRCGLKRGGGVIKALGHKFGEWQAVPGYEMTPSCTKDGKRWRQCTRTDVCDAIKTTGEPHKQMETIPKFGHRATWKVTKDATPDVAGFAELRCDICNEPLATQVFYYGQKAPSGSVTTADSVAPAIKGNSSTLIKEDPVGISANKTGTGKSNASSSTAKKSTSSSSSKKTTTTTKTTTTSTTKAATVVAAAELPANAVALEDGRTIYVVKNSEGKDVALNVEIVDGKIVVKADLAEGEVIVMYADADAIANPTEENAVVLGEEAVELFENGILAVVKEADLPVALAAK